MEIKSFNKSFIVALLVMCFGFVGMVEYGWAQTKKSVALQTPDPQGSMGTPTMPDNILLKNDNSYKVDNAIKFPINSGLFNKNGGFTATIGLDNTSPADDFITNVPLFYYVHSKTDKFNTVVPVTSGCPTASSNAHKLEKNVSKQIKVKDLANGTFTNGDPNALQLGLCVPTDKVKFIYHGSDPQTLIITVTVI